MVFDIVDLSPLFSLFFFCFYAERAGGLGGHTSYLVVTLRLSSFFDTSMEGFYDEGLFYFLKICSNNL